MPGPAVSYVVLGAVWIGGAIFGGDAFHNSLDAVLYVLFAVSVILVGVAGATLSHREGRYAVPAVGWPEPPLPVSGGADAPRD
jgi:hypothetical protein